MELLTAAQMRAVEQAAMDSGAATGLELMERAGRGVVEAIFEWRPKLEAKPGRAVVLCGPGNNGGDGFVVARLLKEKGWAVEVFLFGDETRLPPDAMANCQRWREMGTVEPLAKIDPRDLIAAAPDVTIDAFFGTGLGRALPAEIAEIAEMRSRYDLAGDGAWLVSIDVPSGLDSDSGRVIGGRGFAADLTVTFERARIGHYCGEGAEFCGDVRVVGIGIPGEALLQGEMNASGLAAPQELGRFICALGEPRGEPEVKRPASARRGSRAAHKYSYGHAIILAGGVGQGGAARLAARGALRIGAGLVTVGAPPAAMIENAARLDAIMLAPISDAAALTEMLTDRRINTVGLGPGMGVGERTRAMAAAALSDGERGVVLDADALTSFAQAPEDLFAMTRNKKAVLTPHMGEFGRLFPDIRTKLGEPASAGPAYSKVDAAREAAARAGCVLLLKGPDTVVAGPDGSAAIVSAQYERACPWLATAGAGDVLAGMIAGLIARGVDAHSAATRAAWLHQECALEFGPGLIAEDLPEALPSVFRRLGGA